MWNTPGIFNISRLWILQKWVEIKIVCIQWNLFLFLCLLLLGSNTLYFVIFGIVLNAATWLLEAHYFAVCFLGACVFCTEGTETNHSSDLVSKTGISVLLRMHPSMFNFPVWGCASTKVFLVRFWSLVMFYHTGHWLCQGPLELVSSNSSCHAPWSMEHCQTYLNFIDKSLNRDLALDFWVTHLQLSWVMVTPCGLQHGNT